MTESMLVTIERGSSVPMPDANTEIRSVLLQRDPQTRARTMIAEFPAGFERRTVGHYEAGEELLLLGGTLSVAGLTLREGDWAWIPPRALRAGFSTSTGAVAFAWFSAGNDWIRGGEDVGTPRSEFVGWANSALPRLLRTGAPADGPGRSAVLGSGAEVTGAAEVVDLTTRSWRLLGPGASARTDAATFVRWADR